MKLLFDQNLSFKLCRQLGDLYPASAQTGVLGLGNAKDSTVWDAAREGGFLLVTQDADFAEMAALIGPPPKIVWLRCGNRPTAFIADLMRRSAVTIEAFASDDHMACLEID